MQQKNKIEFIFSNSFNENDCNSILISNIIKLNVDYEHFMNEGFSYFILDIYVYPLSSDDMRRGLSYYRYGFPSDSNLKEKNYLIVLIGSDITIEAKIFFM